MFNEWSHLDWQMACKILAEEDAKEKERAKELENEPKPEEIEFSMEKTEEPTETPIEEDFEMADADKDGRLNLDEYKTM